jgi:hypothetical protein
MKEIDFNKYKAAWKSEQGFDKNTLSEEDIRRFLKNKSKEINSLFKKSLVIDIVFKSIIGGSFIVLLFLYYPGQNVVFISSILLAGIILAILYQIGIFKKIPYADYANNNLRKVLESKVDFYTKKYFHSLYVAALSNSLFIVSGMLYYYYFKYGGIKPFDMVDYFVLGIFILAGFILAAFIQVKHHNFHIRQLELCLSEIDENTFSRLILKTRKNKRRQIFLVFLLALICGVLLFAFFLTRA